MLLFLQNMWVRYGAVGFIAAVARTLDIADVHCNLLPLLRPFLKQPVVQVDQEVQKLTLSYFGRVQNYLLRMEKIDTDNIILKVKSLVISRCTVFVIR